MSKRNGIVAITSGVLAVLFLHGCGPEDTCFQRGFPEGNKYVYELAYEQDMPSPVNADDEKPRREKTAIAGTLTVVSTKDKLDCVLDAEVKVTDELTRPAGVVGILTLRMTFKPAETGSWELQESSNKSKSFGDKFFEPLADVFILLGYVVFPIPEAPLRGDEKLAQEVEIPMTSHPKMKGTAEFTLKGFKRGDDNDCVEYEVIFDLTANAGEKAVEEKERIKANTVCLVSQEEGYFVSSVCVLKMGPARNEGKEDDMSDVCKTTISLKLKSVEDIKDK